MKQRVLIIGAGNVIAAKVQRALAASEWAEPVIFDGSSNTLSERQLDGIAAVFNGAMGAARGILDHAQRLYGALERIGPAAGARIRVVHLSSMTVYGSRTGNTDESAPLRTDLGAYGAAHVSAEALAARHPNSMILRPGCEYGPHCAQWTERIARLLWTHRLGDLGALGDGVCNLLFVDDLVTAITSSLRATATGSSCLNLAMSSPPTWNEYFTRFSQALGAVPMSRLSARRMRVETRLLAPPLKVLELLERRLRPRSAAVPPPITPSLLQVCGQNIRLNSRKAEQSLGLVWTPLGEGLRQATAALADDYSLGRISMRRNSIG